MKSIKISVKERTDLGRKATKALRKQDNVPCVMYGGEKTLHFYAHENEFRHMVYTNQVFLVELDLDGKAYKAVMKDLQFHPVSDKLFHIDFVQVTDAKPTVVALPIELTGTSKGVLAGGKLRLRKKYLTVKGFAKDLPETLVIDITTLRIGDVIKVSGLKFKNIDILDPSQSMVIGISASRVSGGVVAEEEEQEEAVETETSEAAESTES